MMSLPYQGYNRHKFHLLLGGAIGKFLQREQEHAHYSLIMLLF